MPTKCIKNSGLVGLRSGVTRRLSAKSFDLTDNLEKDLAKCENLNSFLRNPLNFIHMSLAFIRH